jgi:hypothetical protein
MAAEASTMRRMKREKPLAWPEAYQTLLVTEWFPQIVRHAMHDRRIDVRFYVAPASSHAAFVTSECPKGSDPFVAVYCERCVGNIDDIPSTIYLSHELGHHESWLRGDTSDAFEELMTWRPHTVYEAPATLPRSIREEVLAEEERAWRYGREILAALLPSFPGLKDYARYTSENLAGYRTGLLLV